MPMCFCIPRKDLYFFVLLALLGAIIYSNTLQVPFLFDDSRNIQHPELRLNELTAESLSGALFGGELHERPVANLSFGINYFLGGYDLPGYHIVNITFHILTAFFLYLLLRKTLALPVNRLLFKQDGLIPALTALLWMAHPLATQSVTYIVQRMNLLAAFFFIVSLYCYVQGRTRQAQEPVQGEVWPPWLLFLCSGVAGVLAIGSKEISVTLPVYIFCYEWFFFQDLSWRWLKKKIPWVVALAVGVGVLAFVYLDGHPIRYLLHGYGVRDFTLPERLLTQPRVIWYNISLLFYPHSDRLVFDYNFPVSTSFTSPWTTLTAMAATVGILTSALFYVRKERLLTFCVFWFFGNLVIESSVIPLEMAFEHRTYLPSTFFIFFWVLLLFRLLRNRFVVAGLLLVFACVFSFWTYERNKVWQDPVIFWQDSVAKQPGKARSHNNLGSALYQNNQLEQAEKQFRLALQSNPDYQAAVHNLGLIEFKRANFEQAVELFRRAIEILPGYVDAMNNLAMVYKEQGDPGAAEEYLLKALSIAPDYSVVNKNMGDLLLKTARPDEAMGYLHKALEKQPKDVALLMLLGDAHLMQQQGGKALEMYKRVLQLDAAQAMAHYNIAPLYATEGDAEMAMYHYQEAVNHSPFFTKARYNLANHLFRSGQASAAAEQYGKIIQNIPELSNALNNMGLIRLQEKNTEEAAVYFQAALRIMPENEVARNNLQRLGEVQGENIKTSDVTGE